MLFWFYAQKFLTITQDFHPYKQKWPPEPLPICPTGGRQEENELICSRDTKCRTLASFLHPPSPPTALRQTPWQGPEPWGNNRAMVEEIDLQLAVQCPMTQRACKYPKRVRPHGMNLTSVFCPVLRTQLSLGSASRRTRERRGAQAARQGRMNHHSKSKHSDTCFSHHPSTFTRVCLPLGLVSGHYRGFCVGLRPHVR